MHKAHDGNLSSAGANLLKNTWDHVRFGNDPFAPIPWLWRFGSRKITIEKVYYVKVSIHNLFTLVQICDTDLELHFGNRRVLLEISRETDLTKPATEFLNKTLKSSFKKKKELSIKLLLLEHLNRTALLKDETALSLRLLEQCFWLLNFLYSFGLKQLQPHAIAQKQIKHPSQLKLKRHITSYNDNKIPQLNTFTSLVALSKGYRVYNKRTRLIVKSIHLRFDEIKEMSETSVANNTSGIGSPKRQKSQISDNPDPATRTTKCILLPLSR
ncbi:hypothetical protein Tco_0842520 [Tanacetum coccineum]|uniref:Uncharacterized protein n=1 Tax=Tanacetum coccineum TaxID=301880 RepID=A0ABQ5B3C5_9ASTR